MKYLLFEKVAKYYEIPFDAILDGDRIDLTTDYDYFITHSDVLMFTNPNDIIEKYEYRGHSDKVHKFELYHNLLLLRNFFKSDDDEIIIEEELECGGKLTFKVMRL